MTTVRELTGLAIAGLIGFAAFAFAGSVVTGFQRGPSSLEELRGLFIMAYWFAGPLVLISMVIAAPSVLFLRKRQLLNLWSAVAVFVVCPLVVTATRLFADGQGLADLFDESGFWIVAAEHLSFGLVAGVTFWVVVRMPSNSAMQRTGEVPHAVERER